MSPQALFKASAIINAISVIGHINMGFQTVNPAINTIFSHPAPRGPARRRKRLEFREWQLSHYRYSHVSPASVYLMLTILVYSPPQLAVGQNWRAKDERGKRNLLDSVGEWVMDRI